jgi:hypothetical protein
MCVYVKETDKPEGGEKIRKQKKYVTEKKQNRNKHCRHKHNCLANATFRHIHLICVATPGFTTLNAQHSILKVKVITTNSFTATAIAYQSFEILSNG